MNLNLTQSNIIDKPDSIEKRFYYILGVSIRTCRRAKNFSQEYMAAKLRISQNAYSKIESGKVSSKVLNYQKYIIRL